MSSNINILILDDHQGIVDGYLNRLHGDKSIHVVATLGLAEELIPTLEEAQIDLIILDINVPKSKDDTSPYSILDLIPQIKREHPRTKVLVISMHAQKTLAKNILEAGADGYLVKDDRRAMQYLSTIVNLVDNGGRYLSKAVRHSLDRNPSTLAV